MAKPLYLTNAQIKNINVRMGSAITGEHQEAMLDLADVLLGYTVPRANADVAASVGFSAMTGTGSKAALAAAAAGTASAAYTQAELQGALNRIAALEARLKAVDDALFALNILSA